MTTGKTHGLVELIRKWATGVQTASGNRSPGVE